MNHFQLKEQPLSEHAAITALWKDSRADECLARLNYLVDHGPLGLMLGPGGVGKSALLKRFLSSLSGRCETVYCYLTQLSSAGLLKTVATGLGETPRHGKERLYEQIMDRAMRAEGALLLVFDEAHLLNSEALTDLRLLISSRFNRPAFGHSKWHNCGQIKWNAATYHVITRTVSRAFLMGDDPVNGLCFDGRRRWLLARLIWRTPRSASEWIFNQRGIGQNGRVGGVSRSTVELLRLVSVG